MHLSPSQSARRTLAQECGWLRPAQGWWAWLGDAQVVAALLAAVPVWLALWAIAPLRPPAGWWPWISLLLVQPLLEELVFRGILQGQALRLTTRYGQPRRLGPVTLANGLVTAGFVALHLPAQPLAWALAVAVPSLVFGHLRERFSSVWPAVGMHVVYNAGFGLAAWLASLPLQG